MKKKILALCLVVALMATAIAGATLAYFTDKDVVNNTFTVGNIDITLDEAPVGEDGVADEGTRVKANEYHLYPGMTYDKDPMVTVAAGSEECYVRMEMDINNQLLLDEYLSEYELADILTGYGVNWEYQKSELSEDGTVRTYHFWYKDPVKAAADKDLALEPLFQQIKVPADLDNVEMQALNGLKIDVRAYAIQTEGFTDAADAWDNFPTT